MSDRRHQLEAILDSYPELLDSMFQLATALTRSNAQPDDPAELRRLDRYEDEGLIGAGGMGLVRRVFDPDLQRSVALKVTRPDVEGLVSSFLNEARITARLQHPGIVPIYELGTLEDGRPYFTMREVHGLSMRRLMADGLALRTAISHLQRAAVAVAFAHDMGVVHRDLKPENILVGARGEVVVVDWGVARDLDDAVHIAGTSGTPAYMAPEQARGDPEDRRTDVWALGVVLHEVLYGEPVFGGDPVRALEALRRGDVPSSPSRAGVPPELAVLASSCLSLARAQRPADASMMAAALQAWLDGADRRERAMGLVRRADGLQAAARQLADEADETRLQAAAILDSVPSWAPVRRKKPAWILEQHAAELQARADDKVRQWIHLLSSALELVPDLDDALTRLAKYHRDRHAAAERRLDADTAATHKRQLEFYSRGAHAVYLAGDGALTLHTDPPAEAVLFRYEEIGRRLQPVEVGNLGKTPIHAVELPMGSYLVELRARGHHPARYPVFIERQQHWDGVPPGETSPEPIPLLRQGVLGADEIYVPAGWFYSGSVRDIPQMLPWRRLWCHGLIVERYVVTAARYYDWLNGLIQGGHQDEALRLAPRLTPGHAIEGPLLVPLAASGRFEIGPDSGGPVRADHPVVHLSPEGAEQFAAWRARQTGRPWRLPGELEWEKAARGVDGRIWPWGAFFEPTWCRMRDGYEGPPAPAGVAEHPVDASPYGMVGISGNVQVQCRDPRDMLPRTEGDRVVPPPRPTYDPEGVYVMRGGIFHQRRGMQLSPAFRGWRQARLQAVNHGMRLFRSLTPDDLA